MGETQMAVMGRMTAEESTEEAVHKVKELQDQLIKQRDKAHKTDQRLAVAQKTIREMTRGYEKLKDVDARRDKVSPCHTLIRSSTRTNTARRRWLST
jgi:hypothetical protein